MGESVPQVVALGENCCGCGACAAACPRSCIAMVADDCGFEQPCVDIDACIGCSSCDSVCPVLNKRGKAIPEKVLWAKSDSVEERRLSSSGGVFALLAHRVLDADGIVVGAAWEPGCKTLRHVIVDRIENLDSVMRSKYVQSVIGREVYAGMRSALRAGRRVLFAGTACQVAGLRNYLGKLAESECFFAIDVICHGVPSPKLWERWAIYKERARNAKLRAVNLRSKATGWSSFSSAYEYFEDESGTAIVDSCIFRDDWYMRAFLGNMSLRSSCFDCPAKRSSGSDITLGDFWGIQLAHPDVECEDGVSAVLCNTFKGASAIDTIRPLMEHGESTFEKVLLGNPCLDQSVPKPEGYAAFVSALANDLAIEQMLALWCFEPTFIQRIRSKLHGIAYRIKKLWGGQ